MQPGSKYDMRLTPTSKKALPILALFTAGILFLPSNVDAFGLLGSGTTETVRTIPGEMAGEFQHFFKICAGENDRLELPNILISSDLETQRQQVQAKIPPGFCSYQNFTVEADDPSSITVELIETTNF